MGIVVGDTKTQRTFAIEFSGLIQLTFEDAEPWTEEDTATYRDEIKTGIVRQIFPHSWKKMIDLTIDDVRETTESK